MCCGVTDLPLPMPHDLLLLSLQRRGGLSGGSLLLGLSAILRQPCWQSLHRGSFPRLGRRSCERNFRPVRAPTVVIFTSSLWPPEYSCPSSRLVVRRVYGAGKTQCIALAAYFALRGHYVYYASCENTTITAMAAFMHRLLPRAAEDATPVAIKLLSGPQSSTSASTPLDARDSNRNHTIWNARLVLATTGLHLAHFDTSTGPWLRRLTTPSSSFTTKPSKRPASATLPSWGPCPASAFSCGLAIPSRPQAALGPGGSPKKFAVCLMGSPWASALTFAAAGAAPARANTGGRAAQGGPPTGPDA